MPAGVDPRTWRQAIEQRLNDLLDQSMALITALDMMESTPISRKRRRRTVACWDSEWGLGNVQRAATTGQDNANDEDGHDVEPSEDGETVRWSSDPSIPQEGPRWHGYGA
jgi:hypothetical protein